VVQLLLLQLIASFTTPVAHAQPTTLYIAYQGPLSGPEALLGISELTAVQFAVKKFNSASDGTYEVKVIEVDDQGDPAIAGTVAPAIGKDTKILGLVGPAYSGASMVSLPYYKAGGLAMISPSALRPDLTNPSSSIFGGPVFHRLSPSDGKEGLALATHATKGVKNPTVFILNDESDYAVRLAGFVTDGLKNISGASVVGTDLISYTTTDFSPTIAKIKASGAAVVIHTGYYNQAAIFFIKQLRNSGSKAIFAGGEGVFNSEFIKLAGFYAEGARIIGLPNFKDLDPSAEVIFQKYMGVSSGVYAIESFDAANIFLQGIKQGNTSRSTMLKWVKSYKGIGISGNSIVFDKNGDVIGSSVRVATVKNAKFVFESTQITWPSYVTQIPEKQAVAASSGVVKSILCARGLVSRIFRSSNPKCPAGYSELPLDSVQGKSPIPPITNPYCPVGINALKIAIAYDIGGRGDMAFNDSAGSVLDKLRAECSVTSAEVTVTTGSDSEREDKLRSLAKAGYNPIIAVGFLYAGPIKAVASDYPNVKFAIIDDSSVDLLNVASLVFAEEQGSYLAGVAAALASKSGKVGYIGGVRIPLLQKFEAGFVAGVKATKKSVSVDVKYVTEFPDFSGFNDPAKAQVIAKGMIDKGVDVIYSAAGGSGAGNFRAATAAAKAGKKVWTIGVDSDQILTASADEKKNMLTSMIKRVDRAVYDVIATAVAGSSVNDILDESGIYGRVYNLALDGVGVSYTGGYINKYKAQIDKAAAAIKSGKIKVPTKP